jgi:choline transport protein
MSDMPQVSSKYDIPANAVYLTVVVVVLMSLIQIGSAVAFNQILAFGVGSMLTTYMISIGCIALQRIRGIPLLPSRFNLGRLGLVVNLSSLAFLLLIYIFAFFPPVPNPSYAEMNWGILGYGVVILFSLAYYLVRARFEYVGPVEYVRKDT